MVTKIEQMLSNKLWIYERFLILQLWKPAIPLLSIASLFCVIMKRDMSWLCAFGVSIYESKPSLTIKPKICDNHWKTIVVNGQSQEKHSTVMVQWQQNHWKTIESNGAQEKNYHHPIILKKLPLSKPNFVPREKGLIKSQSFTCALIGQHHSWVWLMRLLLFANT